MKIAICGSIKFAEEMKGVKKQLEALGHTALLPYSAEVGDLKPYWAELRARDLKEFAKIKGERVRGHFEKIVACDAILVLNYDKEGRRNYIGPNTFLEMGVAFHEGKKIFLLNPIMESDANYEELLALQPIVLEGDLRKIA